MYKKIFKNQIWHFMLMVIFIVIIKWGVTLDKEVLNGCLFGINTKFWFWVGIFIPILHQMYVFIIWRFELYTSVFTKKMGLKKAFQTYAIGFTILFVLRLISIILLAYSNKNTLDINPMYSYIVAVFIIPFVIYLFYSVKKYFTIERAYGIDHFDKEYNVPYVKKGIFRYVNNGMYIFGLLILYLPGLLLLSKAGILVAIFNHIYIWVHYYTVELPDMKYIYKK